MLSPEEFKKEVEKKREELQQVFGYEKHQAVPYFEDMLAYDIETLCEMNRMHEYISDAAPEDRPALVEKYKALRESLTRRPGAPEKIRLWPEGKIPVSADYTDNSDYRYNHDPDFVPYMLEMLIPEDESPKGAIVMCSGGDHGECVLTDGYQTALDLNALGYQCFLVMNRTNNMPWNAQDSGADISRAIRYVRQNAEKYRLATAFVAAAGFSNGGLTIENCIQYYSGEQTMKDHYPDYEPDELDAYYGAPDAFLCVYGPRFVNGPFDYSRVMYPPVFFAIGRGDTAIDNFNYTYPTLLAHGVQVEIHTFAGVPHGMAGIRRCWPERKYPNFDLWLPLADAFLQDVKNQIE